jgi:hypothetical protein
LVSIDLNDFIDEVYPEDLRDKAGTYSLNLVRARLATGKNR